MHKMQDKEKDIYALIIEKDMDMGSIRMRISFNRSYDVLRAANCALSSPPRRVAGDAYYNSDN